MSKPIFHNNQFNISNLISFIKQVAYNSYKLLTILVFLSFLMFITSTSKYVSTVSFYTNYQRATDSSAISFLSNLSSINGDSDLGFSIKDFIQSDRFLINLVNKTYNINGDNILLKDYWSDGFDDFSLNPIVVLSRLNKRMHFSDKLTIEDKKLYFAKNVLLKSMTYSSDNKTGLHTITVKVKGSPELSHEISKSIYFSIVEYYTSITNLKAKEKKEFISARLSVIKANLEQSEEALLKFVETNKSLLNSPKLVLEKERIERDINLYNQIYVNLYSQLEMAKIDETNNTSTIYLLDSKISEFKSGANFFISTIKFIFLFYFIACAYYLFRNRKELFI